MKVVHKYVMTNAREQTLKLPRWSTVLSVAEQNNNPVLYALVERDETDTEDHRFHVAVTGSTVPENLKFIGTVMLDNGGFVLHVFENVR